MKNEELPERHAERSEASWLRSNPNVSTPIGLLPLARCFTAFSMTFLFIPHSSFFIKRSVIFAALFRGAATALGKGG